MGLIPFPGLLTVRFVSESSCPFLMLVAVTMLFLAKSLVLTSDGDGFFIPSPSALSMVRMAFTSSLSSWGSSDALWSGTRHLFIQRDMFFYHGGTESNCCQCYFNSEGMI